MKTIVEIAWLLAGVYFALGSVFAVIFHLRGLREVDQGTHGAGVGFRTLITPGLIALWPLMTGVWLGHVKGRVPAQPESSVSPERLRVWHRLVWKVLAVAVPVILGAALLWRQPDHRAQSLPSPLKASPTCISPPAR